MVSVVVSGAQGRTGRRVVAELEQHPDVERVVALDVAPPSAELKRSFEGADAVVHLGWATSIGAVLDAAGSAGVRTFVYRSSAAVYGAWSDNQVPLTEDVPLRPNPGFSFAIEHAEAERRVSEWRDDHPGSTAAILRTAPVLSPGGESWESTTLGRPSRLRRGEALPPVQFLHVDDAASAFVHAVLRGLDGAYNVAPDGHVGGETARALASSGLTIPLPDRLAGPAGRWAWRMGWGGAPPAAGPYLVHPWVVANDRLTATGWSPVHTNEEALVDARKGSWWRELSPKRRQELALGVVGVTLAALGAGAFVAVRAARRRSRVTAVG